MRRPAYQIPLLFIAVLVVLGPLCTHQFLDYDDSINIYANAEVTNFNLTNLLRFWQRPYINLYIPLTYNLWSLLTALSAHLPGGAAGQPNTYLFHSVNLLAHLLSASTVLFILQRLFNNHSTFNSKQCCPVKILRGAPPPFTGGGWGVGEVANSRAVVNFPPTLTLPRPGGGNSVQSPLEGDKGIGLNANWNRWAAWAGALLFAIHPVQVEPVAWATGLKDVLSGSLALLAIWQYIVYVQSGDGGEGRGLVRHYAGATLFFLLALLAKPGAVVTPLVACVIAYLLLERRPARLALEMLPWLGLTLPVIWVTQAAQAEPNHVFIPALWQRLLVGGDTFSFYLYKLGWPITLGPDYGRTPQSVLAHGWVYLTGLLPYAALALVLCKGKRPLVAAVGVFVCVLLPVSGVTPFVFQQISTVADRYLYLAMLGPALGLGWLLSAYRRPWFWGLALLALSLLGLKSMWQVPHWQGPLTFYEQALRVNPRSWTAYNNLGNLKADMGQPEEALVAYEKAVAADPTYADAYNNIGVTRARLGQAEEAIRAFEKALEINPYFVEAYVNLAELLKGNGQGEKAIELYQWAIKADPAAAKAYRSLCPLYYEFQQYEAAAACYQRLLALEPGTAAIYNNLGTVYKDLNQTAEAEKAYRQALAISPESAEAYNNLGSLFAAANNYLEALPFYTKAVELVPTHPQLIHNLALTYASLGRQEEAVVWLEKAIAADGSFAPAYNDLARIYLGMKQFDLAVQYADRAQALGQMDPELMQAVAPYRGQP